MTTITREQLIKKAQEQIEFCRHTKITGEGRAHVNQCAALFEIALAAMDSEPVAVVEPSDYVTAAQLVGEGPVRKAVHELYEGALRIGDKLYRHAQPALVPDKMTYQDGVLFVLNNDMSSIERGTVAMRAWNACRAAMLQAGNSPVIPDGYMMVPMRLTAENGAKGVLSGEFSETKFVNCPECFGDDECETCDGSGRIEITVPVTWTTIKEIWAKGVEHFAAAPQEAK